MLTTDIIYLLADFRVNNLLRFWLGFLCFSCDYVTRLTRTNHASAGRIKVGTRSSPLATSGRSGCTPSERRRPPHRTRSTHRRRFRRRHCGSSTSTRDRSGSIVSPADPVYRGLPLANPPLPLRRLDQRFWID